MGKTQKPKSFIQMARDLPEWIEKNPVAFCLLAFFARRARRTPGEVTFRTQVVYLDTREFITGRISASEALGIGEGQYRIAYQKLARYGFVKTINATKRFTVGKLLDNSIFYINPEDEQPSRRPSQKPSGNHQVTTNNNEKNEKKDKYNKYTASAVEDSSFPNKKNEPRENPILEPGTRNKGLESLKSHLISRGVIGDPKRATTKWQYEADRIAKKLSIQNPSSSWFKLFKKAFQTKRQSLLLQAVTSSIDAPNVRDKEKYFFKAFHRLVKGK